MSRPNSRHVTPSKKQRDVIVIQVDDELNTNKRDVNQDSTKKSKKSKDQSQKSKKPQQGTSINPILIDYNDTKDPKARRDKNSQKQIVVQDLLKIQKPINSNSLLKNSVKRVDLRQSELGYSPTKIKKQKRQSLNDQAQPNIQNPEQSPVKQFKASIQRQNKIIQRSKKASSVSPAHIIPIDAPRQQNTSLISKVQAKRCRRCGKTNHFQRNCNEKSCYGCQYCLGNHNRYSCGKQKCFNCNKQGHLAMNCNQSVERCPSCNKTGHIQTECGVLKQKGDFKEEDYSQSDMNKTICLYCGLEGHINCQLKSCYVDIIYRDIQTTNNHQSSVSSNYKGNNSVYKYSTDQHQPQPGQFIGYVVSDSRNDQRSNFQHQSPYGNWSRKETQYAERESKRKINNSRTGYYRKYL